MTAETSALPSNLRIDDRLRRVEERSACWEWEIDGLAVWPLFKVSIATKALELSLTTGVRGNLHKSIWRKTLLLQPMARRFTSGRLTKPSRIRASSEPGSVLFYGSQKSSSLIGDRWIMQPYNGLMLAAQKDGMRVQQWLEDCDDQAPFVRQNWQANTHGIASWLNDARRLSGTRDRVPVPPQCQPAIDACSELCGISHDAAKAWLSQLVSSCVRLKDHFVEVFSDLKPKYVVLCSGGYWSTAALTAAARRCGVPSVEVQHGIMRAGLDFPFLLHPTHPNTLADGFVASVKAREQGQDLATFDRSRLIYGRWGTQALLHDNWLPEALSDVLTKQDQHRQALMKSQPGRLHVLVTHQHFDDLEWLVALARNVGAKFHFWVRFRGGKFPNNCDKRIVTLPNCEWEHSSSCSLARLMSDMDLHITQYSASALEAADLGLETLVLHEIGSTIYGDNAPSEITVLNVEAVATALDDLRHTNRSIPAMDKKIWDRITNAVDIS